MTRRRSRFRRATKGACLVLTLAFAPVWLMSMRFTMARVAWASYSSPSAESSVNTSFQILGNGGLLMFWLSDPLPQPDESHVDIEWMGNDTAPIQWWWRFDRIPAPPSVPGSAAPLGTVGASVFIPLWAPSLVFAALTLALWWPDLRRRIPPGHCPKCRYDLRATPPNSPCPECGSSRTPTCVPIPVEARTP